MPAGNHPLPRQYAGLWGANHDSWNGHGVSNAAHPVPGRRQPDPVPQRSGRRHDLSHPANQLPETGNVLPCRRSNDLPGGSAPELWPHLQPTVADPVPTSVHPMPDVANPVPDVADPVPNGPDPVPCIADPMSVEHDEHHPVPDDPVHGLCSDCHRVWSQHPHELPARCHPMHRAANHTLPGSNHHMPAESNHGLPVCPHAVPETHHSLSGSDSRHDVRTHDDSEHAYRLQPHANPMPGYRRSMPITSAS